MDLDPVRVTYHPDRVKDNRVSKLKKLYIKTESK